MRAVFLWRVAMDMSTFESLSIAIALARVVFALVEIVRTPCNNSRNCCQNISHEECNETSWDVMRETQ